MTLARIAGFVIFLGFIAAAAVVEVRWTHHLIADEAHSYWRGKLVTAAILMIGVEALFEWIASRPSADGPRRRGFPVVPARKD